MKTVTIILTVLLLLTLVAVAFSNYAKDYVVFGILVLAALKFVGISFYFMELKEAHSFWKIGLVLFLIFFLASIMALVQ